MNIISTLILTLCLSLTTLAQAQETPRLKVVATYSILGDWVKHVCGNKIDLSVLVGPNGDAHTFEPTPQESMRLAEADIIFENGVGFESWLNDLYASSGSKAQRIVITDQMNLIQLETQSSQHQDVDPHVWQSVKNAIIAVNMISSALSQKDPANSEFYQQWAAQYSAELQQLDEWIHAQVNQIPVERRKLVTSHDTFGYFAKEYGFTIIGAAIDSATTEASDPSARQIAELVEGIKSAQVPVIFTENVHNPKLMQMLAEEAHVKLAPALYTDALGEPGCIGQDYIQFMKYNVNVITQELLK